MISGGDASPRTLGFLALTRMELADIERTDIEQTHRTGGGDYTHVGTLLEQARSTLKALVEQFPKDPNWVPAYARVLTQLGDLDQKEHNLEAASQHYEAAQTASRQAFQAAPDDAEAIRQWAWAFRKAGELQSQRPREVVDARQSFANDVCVMRHLVDYQPQIRRWAEDLGFSLMKLADAWMLAPADLVAAQDAYYEALLRRQRVIKSDPSKRFNYTAFAATLKQINELHSRTDEPTLAAAFGEAYQDIQRRIPEVFPGEGTTPADSNKPRLSEAEARRERDRGVMSFVGASRQTIEMKMQLFADERLPLITAGARGCWDQIVRSATVETVAERP